MNPRARILVVEDHPLYREGLLQVLARMADDVACMPVGSPREALDRLKLGHDFDVVLSDWRLPQMDGIALLAEIGRGYPTIARVLYSGTDDPHLAAEAQRAGLMGYLPKTLTAEQLVAAVEQILQGEPWFPRSRPAACVLTARQTTILEQVAHGHGNKHIARTLGITERTVKFHLTLIFDRLGTSSRTEAVTRAAVQGLIRLPNTALPVGARPN
jgi:two-component system, NarL family, nitrate/nitrite response regulator NarL